MASELRSRANDVLRKLLPKLSGQVANFGAGSDTDREGSHYRRYCSASSYRMLDLRGREPVDITNMHTIPSGSFDGGLCLWVLEHVRNPAAAMREMLRVLRPGATLVLGVPLDYPHHGVDSWRFGPAGLAVLAEGWEVQSTTALGANRKVRLDAGLKFFGSGTGNGPLGWLVELKKPGRAAQGGIVSQPTPVIISAGDEEEVVIPIPALEPDTEENAEPADSAASRLSWVDRLVGRSAGEKTDED